MLWITRSHVHVDRVACPWLITRFVDNDAEFLFVPKSQDRPGRQRDRGHPLRRARRGTRPQGWALLLRIHHFKV